MIYHVLFACSKSKSVICKDNLVWNEKTTIESWRKFWKDDSNDLGALGYNLSRLGVDGVTTNIFERDKDIALRAAYLNARLIGKELANVKISVNCLPVLDLPELGSHEVIGDRALGRDVKTISLLGDILCRGLMEEGVSPIIKHIPGHG